MDMTNLMPTQRRKFFVIAVAVRRWRCERARVGFWSGRPAQLASGRPPTRSIL